MKKRNQMDDYFKYKLFRKDQDENQGFPFQAIIHLVLLIVGGIIAFLIVVSAVATWGFEGIIMGFGILMIIYFGLATLFKQ